MNCREARRWLSPYLDSEIDATETFEISEHLRGCETCQERFERERTIDRLLVTKLQSEEMPADCWNAIQRQVFSATRRRWIGRWSPLALAACLAVILSVTSAYLLRPAEPVGAWAVRRFVNASPDNDMFGPVAVASSSVAVELSDMSRAVLRRQVSMERASEVKPGHKMELVRVTRRRDADGVELMEVRLNCCGQPVLMTFAPADQPGRMADVVSALARAPRVSRQQDGVNVAGWQVGDVVVLAVSRHPVEQLIDAVQIEHG